MKQRRSMTRMEQERREIRRWLVGMFVTGVIVVAFGVAFLRAVALCAW